MVGSPGVNVLAPEEFEQLSPNGMHKKSEKSWEGRVGLMLRLRVAGLSALEAA